MEGGLTVGPFTAFSEAVVPSRGRWFLAAQRVGGDEVWLRADDPAEGVDHGGAALATRLQSVSHPCLPEVVHMEPGVGLAVRAPAGVPLASLLRHRKEAGFTLTPGTLLDIGRQVADALTAAHERGRPHGHLWPGCLWVARGGRVVVWGLEEGQEAAPERAWMSPEHARGERVSGDTDQWALGALLASLITARQPWREEEADAEAAVGDLSHLTGPVGEQWRSLGRLVARVTAVSRRDRFGSMHPVRTALDALSQRVQQDSDLGGIALELWARYGIPLPQDVVATEPDVGGAVLAPEPVPVSTPVSAPEAAPVPAPMPPAMAAPADTFDDLDADTVAKTAPTKVPDPEDAWLHDLPDEEPGGHDPGSLPSLGDPDVATVRVPAMAARQEAAPAWANAADDRFDIQRYAPYAVLVMLALLVGVAIAELL